MKKFLILALTFFSVSNFATAQVSMAPVCQLKCGEILFTKYVNGHAVPEMDTDGKEIINQLGPNVRTFVYSKEPNLPPGLYDKTDPRIVVLRTTAKICGVFLSAMNDEGDFIERMIPSSQQEDLKIINRPYFLSHKHEFQFDETPDGKPSFAKIYQLRPKFMLWNDFLDEMTKWVNFYKRNGFCSSN